VIANPSTFLPLGWLRGLDLNQRPLGYEGKFGRHDTQEKPMRTSDDMGLQRDAIGASRLISVGLLHRRFIAVRSR
jgi:hypothetical protein